MNNKFIIGVISFLLFGNTAFASSYHTPANHPLRQTQPQAISYCENLGYSLLTESQAEDFLIDQSNSFGYWLINPPFEGEADSASKLDGLFRVTKVNYLESDGPVTICFIPPPPPFFAGLDSNLASFSTGIGGVVTGSVGSIWFVLLVFMGTLLAFEVLYQIQSLIMSVGEKERREFKTKKGRSKL